MEVEQLRLILEAVDGVTKAGALVAILWVAKGYFVVSVFCAMVAYIATIIVKGCIDVNKGNTLAERWLQDIFLADKKTWDTDTYGYIGNGRKVSEIVQKLKYNSR